MDISQARSASSIENHLGRNGKSVLASDEIMLLSPYESQENGPQSLDLPGDATESKRVGRQFPGAASIKRKKTEFWKAWDLYRHKPWNMCLLAVMGTLFATGHHLFYLNLDGKEAANQSLMLRYGTVIAFCAKASLGTAVAMAFQQRAWLVVRHRMARLETVDSIFTANFDIFSLLNWSSIKKAKIGTLLALYCWITPLVVVLTSETLSVVVGIKVERMSCPNVRTLNFENEENFEWREPPEINKRPLYSVSVWNTTSLRKGLDDDNPDEFDYWTGLSTEYKLLAVDRTLHMREAVVRKDAVAEICSEGWNCSYVVDFLAPGYKCQELASGVGSKVRSLSGVEAPFNISMIAPEGTHTYYSFTGQGDYEIPQIITDRGGRPKIKPPYPKNLGVFRAEPIMWIGYATVNDTSVWQPSSSDFEGWDKAYTPVIIGCEHYEVNYTVQFNYIEGAPSFGIMRRDYVRKVVNTTYIPGESPIDPDKRLKDRTQATPESNYVYPRDLKNYRRTAAYHSIGYGLRSQLNGSIMRNHSDTDTKIKFTSLLTLPNNVPIQNLQRGIQKLYEDMIISFLAEPSFAAVSWASNGKSSGIAKHGPSIGYPCYRQKATTFFAYNMVQLLAVYAASISLAVVGVLLGLQAYHEEGVMRDMKPSSIIEASRASDLHMLGGQGGAVRIGYGLVQEEPGRSVRSFGVEGNVEQQRSRPET
ncbi:hypothetical protein FSARC_7487 [Fusarium sarcochroum]|uniref:Uncharacterized protein n=1 Tax=Fusarium sarcochroum TaxID=1208366 RepID=A0A8H4TUV3_9HYPO|nr:hypothetical protein FSARC_7487 [Fusarium sarcochroum]